MAMMIALLMSGGVLLAQPPMGKPGPANRPAYGMMQGMLNLTDEQKEQMKQIALDRTKEMLPLRNEMAVLKAEYRKLMAAEKPSEKELSANIDKQTALMNKMKKTGMKYALKMREVLTEEQWLMIQTHRGMRGKGMRGVPYRYGKGPGPGPCGMGPRLWSGRTPMSMAPRWTDNAGPEK